MKAYLAPLQTCFAVILGALSAPWAIANSASVPEHNESYNRAVDQLALKNKLQSIKATSILLKRNTGGPREPALLINLTELLQDSAAIEYRLAYGGMPSSKKQVNLDRYRDLLKQSTLHLSRLISAYPHHTGVPRGYYLRGKAQQELTEHSKAIADYKTLVERFPRAEERSLAAITLADLLSERKDYPGAIHYLGLLTSNPKDRYYPLALNHLAWSYYYLDDIPQALRHVELELTHYRKGADSGKPSTSVNVEKALNQLILFHFTGFEKKKPGYDVTHAMSYFRKVIPAKELGKPLIRYASLLRTKGFDAELEKLRELTAQAKIDPADGFEIEILTLENQLNRRRYTELKNDAEKLILSLEKNDGDAKKIATVRKVVLSATSALQAQYLREKNTPEAPATSAALIELYHLLLKVGGTTPAEAGKVKSNLAELYFELKRFDEATDLYRWIAANTDTPGAQVRAISARYESLQAKHVFPQELTATPRSRQKKGSLTNEIEEWIEWIDETERNGKSDPKMDGFRFEAIRLLYSQGHIQDSVGRLQSYVEKYPSSKYAIPAASLLIDTFISGQEWQETLSLATSLLKLPAWKDAEFSQKLRVVAGDSAYQLVEATYKRQDYASALDQAERFLEQHPTSAHVLDARALVANCALALNRKEVALTHFSDLESKKALKPVMRGVYLLTKASVSEESYDFPAAARIYREYLALAPDQRSLNKAETHELREKNLRLAWLTGIPSELRKALGSPEVCVDDLAQSCGRFEALAALMEKKRALKNEDTLAMLRKVRRASESTRPIWATVALRNTKALSFEDRNYLFDQAVSTWSNQDSFVRYELLAALSQIVPEALALSRTFVRKFGRLRMSKEHIEKRVRLISQVETRAEKLASFPSSTLRLAALQEQVRLNQDFSEDLFALPTPKGLGSQDLKDYQQTLAGINEPFEQKRVAYQTRAAALSEEAPLDDSLELPALADLIEPRKDRRPETTRLHAALTDAFTHQLRGKIAFLIQEATQKKLMDEKALRAARAVSFAYAGARGEALGELFALRLELDSDIRAQLLIPLISAYFGTQAKIKTKTLIEELEDLGRRRWDAAVTTTAQAKSITAAGKWSNAEVPNDFYEGMQNLRTPARENKR